MPAGRWPRAARAVAQQADVIVCSLPSSDGAAPDGGGAGRSHRRRRWIVVETSTLPIAVKEEARRTLATRGAIAARLSVERNRRPGAGEGSRRLRAAAIAAAYRRIVPVLDAFARAHYYVGAFGAGSKMKFVANLLVAIHNVAAAEAIVLAMKAGLDPAMVVKVIGDGAGSSRMFQVRGPMMAKGDYSDATMKLDVWQKDMTIIADFARQLGCPTPLFAATAPIYTAATGAGRSAGHGGGLCGAGGDGGGAREKFKGQRSKVKV